MNLSEIKSVLAKYTKAEQQFRAVYKESGQPITEARLRKILREDGKVINSSQNYSDEEWFQNGENILVCKHLRYSPVSMHTHSFIEISYMLSGSCKEVIQFPSGVTEQLILQQGDFFIIPPKLQHSVEIFNDSIMINILIRTSIMKNTLTRLIAENQALLFLTGTLFTNLQRKYSNCIQFSQITSVGISYIPHVLNYIQQNYRTVTVEELAKHFSVSTSWISRVFRKNARMTLVDTIQQVRVQKACELLQSTKLSVQEIAELVGYQDVTYFIRMFKKREQVTLLQYRKLCAVQD